MSFAYKIHDQHKMYYITLTVNQWANVFTKTKYIDIIIDSLKFCQMKKGLKIYAWVIMSNHIHLIISSDNNKLSDILRDFKKYTSSKIVYAISKNTKEQRKNWLLSIFKKEKKITFWQTGYHGVEITSYKFFDVKLNYIHMNPVRANIVIEPQNYIYSSCADYLEIRKGRIKIEFI
jgi:putative transposase